MDNMKRIQLLQCHESDVNSCDFGKRDRLVTASRFEFSFLTYYYIMYYILIMYVLRTVVSGDFDIHGTRYF